MATSYFRDTNNDGNLATAGNWSTDPAGGSYDLVIAQGNNDLSGSIGGTGHTSLVITAGYKGRNIGYSSAISVTLADNSHVDVEGGPNLQLLRIKRGGTNTGNKLRIYNVPIAMLEIGASSAGFDTVECDSVRSFVCGALADVATIRLMNATIAQLVGAATSTAPSFVAVGPGCQLTTARNFAANAITHIEGMLRSTGSAHLGTSSAKTFVNPGGYLNLRSSGTVVEIEAKPGSRVDAEGAEADPPVTTLRAWPNASIKRDGAGPKLSISSWLPVARRA